MKEEQKTISPKDALVGAGAWITREIVRLRDLQPTSEREKFERLMIQVRNASVAAYASVQDEVALKLWDKTPYDDIPKVAFSLLAVWVSTFSFWANHLARPGRFENREEFLKGTAAAMAEFFYADYEMQLAELEAYSCAYQAGDTGMLYSSMILHLRILRALGHPQLQNVSWAPDHFETQIAFNEEHPTLVPLINFEIEIAITALIESMLKQLIKDYKNLNRRGLRGLLTRIFG